jgi:hypothetical protein
MGQESFSGFGPYILRGEFQFNIFARAALTDVYAVFFVSCTFIPGWYLQLYDVAPFHTPHPAQFITTLLAIRRLITVAIERVVK